MLHEEKLIGSMINPDMVVAYQVAKINAATRICEAAVVRDASGELYDSARDFLIKQFKGE